MTACVCSPPPTPFYADRPFHFLIRDRQTSSILFLGQVQEPTAYSGDDSKATELPRPTLELGPNSAGRFDLNKDGRESALDALVVINYLNEQTKLHAGVQSAALSAAVSIADVDGNGTVTALDALMIINRLNDRLNSIAAEGEGSLLGEGESTGASETSDLTALDGFFTSDEFGMPTTGLRKHR